MPAWLDRVLGRPTTPRFAAAAASAPPSGPAPGTRASGPRGPYGWRNSSALSIDEAVDATPQTVQQIFDLAATGKTSRLIDLYKHTRLKDSRLDAVCSTRVRAIDGRPWVVKPPPGLEQDAAAIEIARNVTSILNETRGLSTIISHLGHGVLEHVAVAQHRWTRNARGWWVTQPEWLHPNRFGWRLPDVVPVWADTETGLDESGKPVASRALSEWPDRFVVFAPVAGRSDYPWMRGAMRSRAAASVAKRFGFRWWLKMIERWGQPQVYAERSDELGTGSGTEVDDAVLKALRTLGTDWRATVPKGTELKAIPVQVVTDLHSRFIEHANSEDGIAILGQNLTTEVAKGGSYAAAKAHQSVRLDILAGDLVELGECITDQWIEPLVRFNWPGAPVPYLEFLIGLRDPITVQEFQAGFCDVDTWRASKGYEPEPDGRGKRYFSGAAPVTRVVSGTPADDPAADPIDVEIAEPEQSSTSETPAEAEDVAKEAASNGAVVADLAFNGAQVQALQGMVTAVGVDLAPRAAELIITTAFPSVDEATAREMVGEQQTFSATHKVTQPQAAQSATTEGT